MYKYKILFFILLCCFGFLISIPIYAAQDPVLPGTTNVEVKQDTGRVDCSKCNTSDCKQYCGDYQLNDLLSLANKIIKIILSVIGSVAFLFFVYGGIIFLFSGGSEERVKKGRDILIASIVGLIITFGSVLIVDFAMKALGVSNNDWKVSNWFEQSNTKK